MKSCAGILLLLLFSTLGVAGQSAETNGFSAPPSGQISEAFAVTNSELSAWFSCGVADERIQFGKLSRFDGNNTTELPAKPVVSIFGSLHLHFEGQEYATDYQRKLDSQAGSVRVDYRVDEVSYRREAFVSAAVPAIVMRIKADHRGRLNFTARMKSQSTNFPGGVVAGNMLSLIGETSGSVRFDSRVKINVTGGSVAISGGAIEVKNADAATLFITVANGSRRFFDRPAALARRSSQALEQISRRTFAALLADHLTRTNRSKPTATFL